MKKNLHILLFSILMVVACSTHNNIVLHETDAENTINVAPGDTLTLELTGTPSTGYLWEISTEPNSLLSGWQKNGSHQQSTMPGSPALQTYQATVTGKGHGVINAYYYRPWLGKNSEDAKKIKFYIQSGD